MSEDPDLERRLEAMFASARPRRGLEDELWRRIQARRPWHQRLGLRLQPALRFAPALATLLIVAFGVTWLAGNFRGGLGSGASTTSAGAPALGSQKASAPAFGVLPALGPGGSRSATAPQASAGGADSNAGAGFSGTPVILPGELPVYRYDEPTASDRATAAATLQAQSGLVVIVTASDPARGVEPQFLINGPAPGGPAPACPTAACSWAAEANAFLTSHNEAPRFAFQVSVFPAAGQVVYVRQFDGPTGPIRQVRPDGTGTGLTVDLAGATVSVRGPLDLPLTSAPYPLRSATDALAAANVHQGTVGGSFDRAELVYVLVVSGGHGYYEPELLLTGPAGLVLAPVIAPGWLGA
jgi:hypothetical protein